MRIARSSFETLLEPLGVATAVAADDAGLLEALRRLYGDWRAEPAAAAARLSLRFEIGADVDERGVADIGINGSRLTLRGAGVAGWADAGTGEAGARVSPRLAADPAALAEAADTLLLFLLTRSGRIPVHAAGVMAGGTALVLAGRSGAGKSTLALRAMQRGLPILSDDTVYIQLQPDLRVWGFRRPLHVFPEEAPRFTDGTRLRAGRLKAVVPLSSAAAGGPLCADRAELIVLARGAAVALEPLDAAAALAALSRLDAGFDLLAEASAEAITALAARGAWRLTLTRDPEAALDLLCARFEGSALAGPAD